MPLTFILLLPPFRINYQQKRMEHKPASAKRKSHQQAPAATTEDAQVAQVAEALSLAGQAPAAKVFVCGGHPSTPVPQRTQNFMSRVRQVVCSSYHAWFLLGSSPPLSLVLLELFPIISNYFNS